MSDKLIFNCADRMTKKSSTSRCFMNNDEFPKEVQKEIERMKHHCNKKLIEKITELEQSNWKGNPSLDVMYELFELAGIEYREF